MQGASFCVQQTPEQAVNIFCNANLQTEMNTLMGKLRNNDVVDFHNVLFTTSITINLCSKLPSSCTGPSGYVAQNGIVFENANFAYSANQNILLECVPCFSGIFTNANGLSFVNWKINMTGSTTGGVQGNTIFVRGFTGAIYQNWYVCCGYFSLLEDQSSMQSSKVKGWDVESTSVAGTKFAVALSDFGSVSGSSFNFVDGGITNAGSNLLISDVAIVGNYYCIEINQLATVKGSSFLCPTDIHVINTGSAIVDGNAFLIGGTPFLVDAGGFLFAGNNLNFNPVGIFTVTVTASPFTFTDTAFVNEAVYISGGTITSITKSGVNLFPGGIPVGGDLTVNLYPAQSIIITYTVLPTVRVDEF